MHFFFETSKVWLFLSNVKLNSQGHLGSSLSSLEHLETKKKPSLEVKSKNTKKIQKNKKKLEKVTKKHGARLIWDGLGLEPHGGC